MKRTMLWLTSLMFLFLALQGQDYVFGRDRSRYYTMIESQVKDTLFLEFLRSRGAKLETDSNGLLRIYVHGTPETVPLVIKFLNIMKMRMELIVGNVVNARNSWPAGVAPYRKKDILIDKNGNASVVSDNAPPVKRYVPDHPHADADGYVLFPNINVAEEIVNIHDTLREYYLAEALLERCLPDNYVPDSSIQMMRWNAAYFNDTAEYRDRLDRIERKFDALKLPGKE